MALPRGAMGLYAVCGCGIFLIILTIYNAAEMISKLLYQAWCSFSESVKSMVYVVISDFAAFSNHYFMAGGMLFV